VRSLSSVSTLRSDSNSLRSWLQSTQSDNRVLGSVNKLRTHLLTHKEALLAGGVSQALFVEIVDTCVTHSIFFTKIGPLSSRPPSTITTPSNNPLSSPNFSTIMGLIATCFNTNKPELLPRVLDRLLETPENTAPADWARYLVAFIPVLDRKLTAEFGCSLELPVFSTFCAAVARRFIELVLATPQTSALPYLLGHVGCSCSHCGVMRRFVSGPDCSLTITSSELDHMFTALQHVPAKWGINWTRVGKDQVKVRALLLTRGAISSLSTSFYSCRSLGTFGQRRSR